MRLYTKIKPFLDLPIYDTQMREYKVCIYKESSLSSIIFGSGKVDPILLEEKLNELWVEWRELVSQSPENRRDYLFRSREAIVMILKRKKY